MQGTRLITRRLTGTATRMPVAWFRRLLDHRTFRRNRWREALRPRASSSPSTCTESTGVAVVARSSCAQTAAGNRCRDTCGVRARDARLGHPGVARVGLAVVHLRGAAYEPAHPSTLAREARGPDSSVNPPRRRAGPCVVGSARNGHSSEKSASPSAASTPEPTE